MNKKLRNINLLIILVLSLLSCNKSNLNKTNTPSEQDLNAFDNEIHFLMKEMDVKEYSYAIVDEKQIIKESGNKDDKTLFPIGTLSSIFVSSIMFQQIEQAKIELKEKTETYIPDNGYKGTVKQLLCHILPEDEEFYFNPQNIDLSAEIVANASSLSLKDLFKKGIYKKAGLKYTEYSPDQNFSDAFQSNISDLAAFSIALDKSELFNEKATQAQMLRPVFLSNGELNPSGMGFMFQFYNNKKIAWSFGVGKDFSSLMIKSLSDSLTFIILAKSENMNKPFELEKGQLFNSPIATAFLKKFLMGMVHLPTFNLGGSDTNLKDSLRMVDTSFHKNLLVKEFISYIKMYSFLQKRTQADRLISIYKAIRPNDLPVDFIFSKPLASIDEVSDYLLYKRTFYIEKDTIVSVFAVGEYAKDFTNNIWNYDNTEIYLNPSNKKSEKYIDSLHFQFRINYDFKDSVTGKSLKPDNIKFVQADPTSNSYLFEIRIPWKTVRHKPKAGTNIGFDISVSDNDGKNRESLINWHFQKSDQAWENPNVFGIMHLLDENEKFKSDSICTSKMIDQPLVLDGKIDPIWRKTVSYPILRTTSDSFPIPEDLSASFSSLWDNENIYLLVEVKDNFKSKIGYTSDYGWILNEKNDTVWMMDTEHALYAGGNRSNRYVKERINLKKGRYTLYYQTNQTNSYYLWEGKRPSFSFYGIAVY